ncbi:MAG: bifunctional (p)ppGpp synthetase/guanosine-3',5'-bis(diphosphate) 3'-pyrophosphohydrolase [Deltaproteobacteria bacterium]|nr:MAG: bifunctional (p)ppGpp synthetase/guanosine-3',5'-bis(diphosphate) 3'-pyrophosphohydrolase [Deltaproteobacteria bacterium]
MSAALRSALLATFLASPAFAAVGELSEDSLPKIAPMAERAGMGPGAALLQDEAFAIVDPGLFASLRDARAAEIVDENRALAAARGHVDGVLRALGSDAQVSGRIKSLYSLHAKMQAKSLAMDQVLDRVALRVIVEDDAEAYAVHELIAERFAVIGESVDDYIANPKPSGYQALHLAMVEPHTRRPVEVQIRTRAAHHAAEHGDAAHWRYKLA